jgi:hypothetical protein
MNIISELLINILKGIESDSSIIKNSIIFMNSILLSLQGDPVKLVDYLESFQLQEVLQ